MSLHPHLQYYVVREDESKSQSGINTYIPTLGLPASSFDAYRVSGIHSVANKPNSWSMTDTDASAALGRIIDGPISSHLDIEKAESALRAILLNDYIEVLVPCVKARHDTGIITYIRLDKNERNEAAFKALEKLPSRDLLFATEFVNVSGGIISSSSNSSSAVTGEPIEKIDLFYNSLLKTSSESALALSTQLGAFSYFTNDNLTSATKNGTAGFIDSLYSRIYKPWMEVAQCTPTLHAELKLPPLIAIILSRAPSREKIPEVISELYQELEQVRLKLNLMNEMLDKTMSQADIIASTNRINTSFDAIVAESLLTSVERRKRRIASIFSFLKPVRQLYTIAADPLSADPSKFLELFKSTHEAVANNSRIVSRNIPSAKFSELLRIDSVRESILTHFSDSEVKSIKKC